MRCSEEAAPPLERFIPAVEMTMVGVVTAVYWLESPQRYEHQWAATVQQLPDAAIPVPRFGASDCTCAAHLFYFERPPELENLAVGALLA